MITVPVCDKEGNVLLYDIYVEGIWCGSRAEGIFYDLLVNEVGSNKSASRNLSEYAHQEKSVIIVSPTPLAAHLQSVLYGFKASLGHVMGSISNAGQRADFTYAR
jgi:hypothetical protein